MSNVPSGEEREVRHLGSATIDGAPVAYVVALAGVIAVLAFVPLSVVLGSGKSFPLSQSIYPLVGWLLGPVAGAVADGVGALVGVFLAPHTSALPLATVIGASMGGLAAGSMRTQSKRRGVLLSALFILAYALYMGRAVLWNGAAPLAALAGSFINGSALILFLLPTRETFARWIGDAELSKVAVGLFAGTWMVSGLAHLCSSVVIYWVMNWPNEIWVAMGSLAPFEHLVRSLAGMVIGTGVIAGLRAVGVVKPPHALY